MILAARKIVISLQKLVFDQTKIRVIVSHMIIVYELPFCFVEYELLSLLMKSTTLH